MKLEVSRLQRAPTGIDSARQLRLLLTPENKVRTVGNSTWQNLRVCVPVILHTRLERERETYTHPGKIARF